MKTETKDRQVQIRMKESMYKKLAEKCFSLDISIAAFIRGLVRDALSPKPVKARRVKA